MKAIETRYKGYRFRSRLEARWAVFFDALGIVWEYEKEGYDLDDAGRYLPDFWLPQVQMWAEVKPQTLIVGELNRCWALCAATGHPVLLLDGAPDFRSYFVCDHHEPEWLMNTSGEVAHITDGGYPGGDYDTPVPWMDAVIGTDYLHEHRFYMNTGEAKWPTPARWEPSNPEDDYTAAVYAARSARFEYGENGR